MKTATDRLSIVRTPQSGKSNAPVHSPVVLGSLAAMQSVLGSLVCLLAPVLAVWQVSAHAHAGWWRATTIGVDLWLLGHRATIIVPSGAVSLAPALLILLNAWWCWAGAFRMGNAMRMLRLGHLRSHSLWSWFTFVVCYTTMVTGVAALTQDAKEYAKVLTVAVGAAVMSSVLGMFALIRGILAGRSLSVIRAAGLVPAWAVPLAKPITWFLASWLSSGLLLAGWAVYAGRDKVMMLWRALSEDLVSDVGLGVAQAAYAPNVMVWAGSWLTGAGFRLGVDSQVSPVETQVGSLPAFPLLGGIPEPGPWPVWVLWVAMSVPVLCALWPGVLVVRGFREHGWARVAVMAAAVAVAIGLAGVALGWLTSGGLGEGRLVVLGPQVLHLGWRLAALAAVGFALVIGVAWYREARTEAATQA